MDRHAKYERLLRRLRQRIFDYDDARQDQCSRLIARCKAICMPRWEHEARMRDRTNSQQFMFRHA